MSDLPSLSKQLPSHEPLGKRLGSLQAFQSRVASRIEQAQTGELQNASLLSLRVQGFQLLLPMSDVSELVPLMELTPLPLSKRWVSGLTVVRSEVITVFDMGFCLTKLFPADPSDAERSNVLGETAKTSEAKLVVLNKSVGKQLAFVSDRLLGTIAPLSAGFTLLETNAVHSTPAELPFLNALERSYIKQLWRNKDGTLFIELSLLALFQSPDFISITH